MFCGQIHRIEIWISGRRIRFLSCFPACFSLIVRLGLIVSKDWAQAWKGMELTPATNADFKDSTGSERRSADVERRKRKDMRVAAASAAAAAARMSAVAQEGSFVPSAEKWMIVEPALQICAWRVGAVPAVVLGTNLERPSEPCLLQMTDDLMCVTTVSSRCVFRLSSFLSAHYMDGFVLFCSFSQERVMLVFDSAESRWSVAVRLRRHQQSAMLRAIPEPIVRQVLRYLDDTSLGLAGQSCRRFFYASKPELVRRDPSVWMLWKPQGLAVMWKMMNNRVMTIGLTRNDSCNVNDEAPVLFYQQSVNTTIQIGLTIGRSVVRDQCRVVVITSDNKVLWISRRLSNVEKQVLQFTFLCVNTCFQNKKTKQRFEVVKSMQLKSPELVVVAGTETTFRVSNMEIDDSDTSLQCCFVSGSQVIFSPVKEKTAMFLCTDTPLATNTTYRVFLTRFQTEEVCLKHCFVCFKQISAD
jgi:hypothetical protein